jgi:hypothetical protein
MICLNILLVFQHIFPTELKEIGWGGVDWIDLAQDMDKLTALVNAVMNLRVPKMLGNYQVFFLNYFISNQNYSDSIS